MPVVSGWFRRRTHHHRADRHRRRWVYAAGYLAMAVAGVFAGLFPSPSVSNAAAADHYLVTLWDIFLLCGGIASSAGAITGRWLGEYVGLPLLASVFAVYGVAAFAAANATAGSAGSAFVGIALLFMGRWTDVAAGKNLAAAAGRMDREPSEPLPDQETPGR